MGSELVSECMSSRIRPDVFQKFWKQENVKTISTSTSDLQTIFLF